MTHNLEKIVQAIAVTCELTNTQLTGQAIAVMARDLTSAYSEESILRALDRCRKELTRRLTLADVIDRIEEADGRPGSNEAWGIAILGFDESETIITNDEICAAMAAARPIMEMGDEIGARMAFRDAYERVIRENREQGRKPNWWPSLGHDPIRRVDAIQAAVDVGRLSHKQASAYLPAPITDEERQRGAAIAGLLNGKVVDVPDPEFKRRISELMDVLKR